jgi:hypothetical protein
MTRPNQRWRLCRCSLVTGKPSTFASIFCVKLALQAHNSPFWSVCRRPKVTVWRVRDAAPFFSLVMHSADPKPDPALAPPPKPSRLWSLVSKVLGKTDGPGSSSTAVAGGGAGAAAAIDSNALVSYESKAMFSPDGSRVAVWSAGNVWVWDVRSHSQSAKLIEHINHASSYPTFEAAPTPASASESTPTPTSPATFNPANGNEICDISWWSDAVLARIYRSGHLVLCPVRSTFNLLLGDELFAAGYPKLAFAPPLPPSTAIAPPLSRIMSEPSPSTALITTSAVDSTSLVPVAPTAPTTLPPAQRLFVLECERHFQRRRKVWTQAASSQSSGAGHSASSYHSEPHNRVHLRRAYRLLSVCRATPSDFFLRKVADRQFGTSIAFLMRFDALALFCAFFCALIRFCATDEAVELARVYSLNADPIYQMQWSCTAVSPASIQHYLPRITDKAWVIDECLVCAALFDELATLHLTLSCLVFYSAGCVMMRTALAHFWSTA